MKTLYQSENQKFRVVGFELSALLAEVFSGYVKKAYFQKKFGGEVVTVVLCSGGFLDVDVAGMYLDDITVAVIRKIQEYLKEV